MSLSVLDLAEIKEIADQWPPYVLQAATTAWSIAAARFSRSYRVAVCSPHTIMTIHQP